jgi:MerR family mercuric resistance operon transcriptional regulator
MIEITTSRALPIGEISRRTGVNIETIRYYERIGIVPKPSRTQGGHRSYDSEQMKRLAFIRRGRELGFSLDDIRALLDLVDSGAYSCGEVYEMTMNHLAAVRRKIADLRRIERVLKAMADRCRHGDVPQCPIVDALFRQGAAAGAPRAAEPI